MRTGLFLGDVFHFGEARVKDAASEIESGDGVIDAEPSRKSFGLCFPNGGCCWYWKDHAWNVTGMHAHHSSATPQLDDSQPRQVSARIGTG